jgi:lauroyl/myristoyl acyltransferase
MFPVQIHFLYLVHHYCRSDWIGDSNLVYSSPMYYIVYGLFFMLSLLPMRILYFISDGIYLVVYYVIGYRKKVVMKNLEIAFPEKSNAERVKIAAFLKKG